ncbi:hypothetical protein OC845_004355 [Tilletia horrida]|nr:hypothetical protein OC845_004355 [Tilletia horrida]
MIDALFLQLGRAVSIPLTAILALREIVIAPKGTSLQMRLGLAWIRLTFNKGFRSVSWAQFAVNGVNAKASAIYTTTLPAPPEGVKAREVKLGSAWSKSLASSKHGWKWFLVEPSEPLTGKRPFILYNHGGSFVTTFSPLHFKYMYDLCQRTGATILTADYPRPPAGTSHEETYAVLTEVVHSLISQPEPATQNPDEKHISDAAQNRTKFVVMGDSAGGSITMGLCLELVHRGWTSDLPEEAIPIAPAMDSLFEGADKYDWHDPWLSLPACWTVAKAWQGPTAAIDHHLVSPGRAADDLVIGLLKSKTRFTVLHGTADILYPQTEIFIKRATDLASRAGITSFEDKVRFIEGPGMPHVWPLFPPVTPEVKSIRSTIASVVLSE